MESLIASVQVKHMLVAAIVLAGTACVISATLILLVRRLFTSHKRLQSVIGKLVQRNGEQREYEPPEKPITDPIKSLHAEADIISNAVRKYLSAQTGDRTETQNQTERSLIDDLAADVSKYLKQASFTEDSHNVQRLLSDYLDRLQSANPAKDEGSSPSVKTQADVISLNDFFEEFPRFLSAKPVPYSGILHAYFSYLISQYVTPVQKHSSEAKQKSLSNPIDIIERHIVQDIIEHIDRIRWEKKNTGDTALTGLKRFEESVLNPILAFYQVTELPAVPGRTRVDVRIHDVLGKQDSDLAMGTVLGVYRRGYQYVDPDTGNSKIMKKSVVYIAG